MVKSLKPSKAKDGIVRVDFSLKREVFFVVVGALLGAVAMVAPKTFFEAQMDLPYYLTWIAFGHILGVYSPPSAAVLAGMVMHLITAISIGIVTGIFLYKTAILNISKPSNGLLYGIIAGIVIFAVFFIPVNQFVLAPEIARTMADLDLGMTQAEAAQMLANNQLLIMIGSIVMHLVFGITLGLISSFLSIKFGARYLCPRHDISFARIDSLQRHMELVHGTKPIKQKRILILGGGFAGIQILQDVQKSFQDDIEIDINLVSKDNFFLFTPMLPEVSSGMIETRHIATPIRTFCNRAKFYEARVKSIDLNNKQVIITHTIGKQIANDDGFAPLHDHQLNYDYLVIALGGETKFFGKNDVKKNAFTMKSLGDAMILRNHIINLLEQADLEHEDDDLRKSLMTFVVVGGGFGGVEAVGELNTFVRESVRTFYHNIDEKKDVKVILVNASDRILPEVSEGLAKFALQKLRDGGVEVMLNKRLEVAEENSAKLKDGAVISTRTIIWAGGVTTSSLVANLLCDHDKGGRIIANNYLQVPQYPNVFALGDCASITDPHTGKPYPPTAQHAIREGKVAAKNLVSLVKNGRSQEEAKEDKSEKKLVAFDYKTMGTMAEIGKRTGVADILGLKLHGFVAWWIWRTYYLANLPTTEKKLRVMVDWTIDLFFKRDVTGVKTFVEEEREKDLPNDKAKKKVAEAL